MLQKSEALMLTVDTRSSLSLCKTSRHPNDGKPEKRKSAGFLKGNQTYSAFSLATKRTYLGMASNNAEKETYSDQPPGWALTLGLILNAAHFCHVQRHNICDTSFVTVVFFHVFERKKYLRAFFGALFE